MNIKRKIILQMFYSCVAFISLFMSQLCYAAIVIGPNTVINTPTTYSNDTIDMTNGSFIIRNNATLTIENCTIIGTVSLTNPVLFNGEMGNVVLTNNMVQLTSSGIIPNPNTQAMQYVMQLTQASVVLTGNNFKIDTQFTVGFLITTINIPTSNIQVRNNTFNNFHGVLYLLNSSNAVIENNYFKVNSFGNLVFLGTHATISNNKFAFSGVSQLGNGMDIIDSDDVMISNNQLFTPTCHGVYILRSQNVTVDGNNITGGKTYAVTVLDSPLFKDKSDYGLKILNKLGKKTFKHAHSSNITVTNNLMGQNRYGLAASDVNTLTVTGNYFSQRFEDAQQRQFWTDNAILLMNVTNLTWTDNIYKEAFTQVNGGDNTNTQFVVFPVTGGVVL